MADTQTYSLDSDLLTGNVPLPEYIDVPKALTDAADEIDSQIGFLYNTPVSMDETGPVSRPARLLLKLISAHLSSGRIIMAVSSAQQSEELHNYGLYLVTFANERLKAIAEGKILLDGAAPAAEADGDPTGPLIYNVDPESNVESFYGRAFTTARVP